MKRSKACEDHVRILLAFVSAYVVGKNPYTQIGAPWVMTPLHWAVGIGGLGSPLYNCDQKRVDWSILQEAFEPKGNMLTKVTSSLLCNRMKPSLAWCLKVVPFVGFTGFMFFFCKGLYQGGTTPLNGISMFSVLSQNYQHIWKIMYAS